MKLYQSISFVVFTVHTACLTEGKSNYSLSTSFSQSSESYHLCLFLLLQSGTNRKQIRRCIQCKTKYANRTVDGTFELIGSHFRYVILPGNGPKQDCMKRLCNSAKSFQADMNIAHEKGLRVMAAYLTTGTSYFATPIHDPVLHMLEGNRMYIGKSIDNRSSHGWCSRWSVFLLRRSRA